MERSTIFHGNTHYFDWAIFNSYVKLPEGIVVCNLYMDIYRVGGWATSWNIVNGKDDIPYMKWKIQFMFETTDYIYTYGMYLQSIINRFQWPLILGMNHPRLFLVPLVWVQTNGRMRAPRNRATGQPGPLTGVDTPLFWCAPMCWESQVHRGTLLIYHLVMTNIAMEHHQF